MKSVKNHKAKKPSGAVVWRVGKYLSRYRALAFGTFFCAVLTTLAGMVYPKITGSVIDEIITQGGSESRLFWACVAVLGAFFARDFLNALRINLNNCLEQNVILDLRCAVYEALQRIPVRWYDEQATGDLMTRVGEDVQNVERVLIDGVEQGSVAVLQIGVIAAVLAMMNWQLMLWMWVPVPFLIAGAVIYTTTAAARYRVQRKAMAAMQALVLDHIQGIRQIKSFVSEEREKTHFREKALGVKQGTLKVMRAWSLYSPSMAWIGATGYVIVLYFGGIEVIREGELTKGELVSFLLFSMMFYEPIGRLHQLNQIWQSARASGERVFGIIDEPKEINEPRNKAAGNKGKVTRVKGDICFDRVSFSYQGSKRVLDNISLKVEAGQCVALVGPTGAGKSTLVNLIPRFYECVEGAVTLDGVDVRDYSLQDLRRNIGWVSQENFLFNLSVRENLLLGAPDADDPSVIKALQSARALDFVMKLPKGLDTVVGERGVKLSVGEKQRLSIARAILKDPPVLILDEATASVDTETEHYIQEALEVLLKGRTSILIAHRLSTVRRADCIWVMEAGKIIEQGDHERLIAQKGLYAKLCRLQAAGAVLNLDDTMFALARGGKSDI